MSNWKNLPEIRQDELVFQDTSKSPLPGTIVPCLLCKKPFLMRKYIGAADQICGECWNTYKDAAKIICKQCKIVICRITPKILDNGFHIKPSMLLHCDHCNICKPGLKKSTIIEIANWEKYLRGHKPTIIKP